MVTIYPLNHPYGNHVDGYFTRNYQATAEYFKSLSDTDIKHHVNLGIQDGVMIIQNMKGDFRGYNMCIVEDESTATLDIYKITAKQYKGSNLWNVTMVIDAFSKYYSDIIQSDILIQRLGYKNYEEFNPILFGQEDFTLSQIKKSQTPINLTTYDTDDVKVGGYVMIFQQNSFTSKITADYNYTPEQIGYDYSVNGISNFAFKNNEYFIVHSENTIDNLVLGTDSLQTLNVYYQTKQVLFSNDIYFYQITNNGTNMFKQTANVLSGLDVTSRAKAIQNYFDSCSNELRYVRTNDFDEEQSTSVDYSLLELQNNIVSYIRDNVLIIYKDYNSYKNYSGKVVYDSNTGKYYKISFIEVDKRPTIIDTEDKDVIKDVFSQAGFSFGNYSDPARFGTNCTTYRAKLTEIKSGNSDALTGTATIGTMRNTSDQGYKCIFVPYFRGATSVTIKEHYYESSVGIDQIRVYSDYKQELILPKLQAFANTYGGDNAVLLDIQEFYGLPENFISELKERFKNIDPVIDFEIEIEGTEVTLDIPTGLTAITSLDAIVIDDVFSYIDQSIFCYAMNKTEGEEYIQQLIEGNSNLKLEQQNTYHLCSPSGTSVYEFSLAKNNGLTGFRYKYNIRPYGSVYQLQPIYNGYYGENYCDTRGLAMEEPTSITLTSSEWETYKRQNVNYINSFESNQEYERSKLQLNLDYQKEQYKLTRTRTGLNSYTQAVGQGVSNSLWGNEIGALTSVTDTLISETYNSLITYAQYRNYQQHQKDELALSQAEERRQWEYSLQNIQALPYNTEKLSDIYNTNTHYFYIETYTPTDYEISMYKTYLDLFGIKIGGILPLSAYSFDYLEGSIVKLSIGVTPEEYEELQNELKSGRRNMEVTE